MCASRVFCAKRENADKTQYTSTPEKNREQLQANVQAPLGSAKSGSKALAPTAVSSSDVRARSREQQLRTLWRRYVSECERRCECMTNADIVNENAVKEGVLQVDEEW